MQNGASAGSRLDRSDVCSERHQQQRDQRRRCHFARMCVCVCVGWWGWCVCVCLGACVFFGLPGQAWRQLCHVTATGCGYIRLILSGAAASMPMAQV